MESYLSKILDIKRVAIRIQDYSKAAAVNVERFIIQFDENNYDNYISLKTNYIDINKVLNNYMRSKKLNRIF